MTSVEERGPDVPFTGWGVRKGDGLDGRERYVVTPRQRDMRSLTGSP